MKKILLVNTIYKSYGGEDSNIIQELDFLKKSYDVRYLEFNNGDKLNIFDYFSFFTSSNLNSNKQLTKALNEFKPDIVYVHNTWFKASLGIFKLLKKENYKTYLKIHNFRYDCSRYFLAKNHLDKESQCMKCGMKKERKIFNKYYADSYLKSFLLIIYGKSYFNVLNSNTLNILVLNNFHKTYLHENGFDDSNVSVFYNPVELSTENLSNYKKDSNYVVYAGRLSPSKGVYELLETWQELNLGDLELRIIGTGELEEELKKKFSGANIKFLGLLSNEETLLQIKNSRAVVSATKMYEGQPRLLNESSSFGVPSVFPYFGGMPEFFPEDYSLSFKQFDYQDLKEKLKLLSDKKLLSLESRRVYEHLDKKINFKEWSNIFKSLD